MASIYRRSIRRRPIAFKRPQVSSATGQVERLARQLADQQGVDPKTFYSNN